MSLSQAAVGSIPHIPHRLSYKPLSLQCSHQPTPIDSVKKSAVVLHNLAFPQGRAVAGGDQGPALHRRQRAALAPTVESSGVRVSGEGRRSEGREQLYVVRVSVRHGHPQLFNCLRELSAPLYPQRYVRLCVLPRVAPPPPSPILQRASVRPPTPSLVRALEVGRVLKEERRRRRGRRRGHRKRRSLEAGEASTEGRKPASDHSEPTRSFRTPRGQTCPPSSV
jgi:hypothetical protein